MWIEAALCGLLSGLADVNTSVPPEADVIRFAAVGSLPRPGRLSETNIFSDIASLKPSPRLRPYQVQVPFWSDGANKRRWIALPLNSEGRVVPATFRPDSPWDFPPGTLFIKHFENPARTGRPEQQRRIETRLLEWDSQGRVSGATYRWREDQSDADLVLETSLIPVAFAGAATPTLWQFLAPADCLKCHVPSAGGVLGVNTRQLNRSPDLECESQLADWAGSGLIDQRLNRADSDRLPRLARQNDETVPIESRVRSYLDANCGYCHRPGGVVADFDARWETPLPRQNLLDAPVRIDFGIDRARGIAPNDPWRSMLLQRILTTTGNRMPPLGHQVVDHHAALLLEEWIRSLPGPPVVAPPTIHPSEGDFTLPVVVSLTHDDAQAEIRFTTNGAPPLDSSPQYVNPFTVDRSMTIRARAFKDGHTRSVPVHATYIISSPPMTSGSTRP